jgi:hypothetical protein
MDILNDSEIEALVAKSKLVPKYKDVVDEESAYEILNAKLAEAAEKQEEVKTNKADAKEESFFDNPIVKSVGRTAATMLTRSLLGALGLGGKSRRY